MRRGGGGAERSGDACVAPAMDLRSRCVRLLGAEREFDEDRITHAGATQASPPISTPPPPLRRERIRLGYNNPRGATQASPPVSTPPPPLRQRHVLQKQSICGCRHSRP